MNKKYDVIVIGAGIGGLVCATSLAKRGQKVLLLEQHTSPGGYCSSFKRKGYTFDACIHHIKIRKNNSLLSNLIEDFGLEDYVRFKLLNISDLVISQSGEFTVNSDVNKTIENICEIFPKEKANIKGFFDLLNTNNVSYLYDKTRNRTFKQLVSLFFKDKKLISIFNCLLMNIGLPMDRVSALKAYYFFREFFYYQSYYPIGGMQQLADALVSAFKQFNGEILYKSDVEKIRLSGAKVTGITCRDIEYRAEYVVSNTDPYNTFFKMIGEKMISKRLANRISKMEPSIPSMNVYLGLSNKIERNYDTDKSLWYFPETDFSSIYDNIENSAPIVDEKYLICSFPSAYDTSLAPNEGTCMIIFSGAHYETDQYWAKNKNRLSDIVIERARKIIPNIEKCIEVKSISSPQTSYRYTRNYKGACYGLASTRKQMPRSYMPQKTEIDNLYMAGHWTTHGIGQGGVSMAAFSGLSAANKIIKNKKRKNI